MKYGWLICNGSLNGNKYQDLHQMYVTSALKNNIKLDIVFNHELNVTIINQKVKVVHDYPQPDFILFLDKDVYLAKALEESGYRLFNKAKVIEICDSKIKTHLYLKDIPSPKTVCSPHIFFNDLSQYSSFNNHLKQQLNYPMVVKEEYGSFGQQVYLVHNDEELASLQQKLGTKSHLYQEYIEESSGCDIRIQMVSDKIVACVKRSSNNDFRSNATLGGKMENIQPDKTYLNLAKEIQKQLQADFCGIDLLITKDGPIFCEVNSNAHVKNLYETTGVNTCDEIMRYIYASLFNL